MSVSLVEGCGFRVGGQGSLRFQRLLFLGLGLGSAGVESLAGGLSRTPP